MPTLSTSVFLAKLIGPLGLAIAIGLLVNAAGYRAMAEEFLTSRALTFLAGVITLPAGLALVLTHNVWAADWRVVITLIGWLLIVSGIIRIVAPQQALAWGRAAARNPVTFKIGAAIWLLIGALFCYFGYIR